jgi:hypothetical protein
MNMGLPDSENWLHKTQFELFHGGTETIIRLGLGFRDCEFDAAC